MTYTRYQCPFCGVIVTGTNFEWGYVATDPGEADRVEADLREHLLAEHPIRWRLNWRLRRAMRQSILNIPDSPRSRLDEMRREALRVVNANIDAAHDETRKDLDRARLLLVAYRERLSEHDESLPPDPYDSRWWDYEAEWIGGRDV